MDGQFYDCQRSVPVGASIHERVNAKHIAGIMGIHFMQIIVPNTDDEEEYSTAKACV